MLVVIPTNRGVDLARLRALIEAGARFIVVDDSEGQVTIDHPQFEVYDWGDRRRLLGARDVAIPKRNGACRDFGLYLAWRRAEAREPILAVDDDCLVYHDDFALRAERTLSAAPRPIVRPRGRHLNILELYDGAPEHLFPRGFPYSARVHHQPCRFDGTDEREPSFSLGLWTGAFDVNAVDKIEGPPWRHHDIELRHASVALPLGCLVSVCSMNMLFRREVLPAVYQLPMHVEVMPGWNIDRYGDIWGGFILKSLMDVRGDLMVAGEPMIRHLKAGDVARNVRQEHLCHLVNDEFLALLEDAVARLEPASYLDMMSALHEQMLAASTRCSPLLGGYLTHLARSLDAWISLLSDSP